MLNPEIGTHKCRNGKHWDCWGAMTPHPRAKKRGSLVQCPCRCHAGPFYTVPEKQFETSYPSNTIGNNRGRKFPIMPLVANGALVSYCAESINYQRLAIVCAKDFWENHLWGETCKIWENGTPLRFDFHRTQDAPRHHSELIHIEKCVEFLNDTEPPKC